MKKSGKTHSEIDFWQSHTDLMTALVLVLLMVIMLLVLYLFQLPETEGVDAPGEGVNDNLDSALGDSLDHLETRPNEDNGDEGEDEGDDSHGGGGGGGGGDEGGGDSESGNNEGDEPYDGGAGTGKEPEPDYEEKYPLPNPGKKWSKSAVYTTVIDEETGRAIRLPGITFELYEEQKSGDGGALRTLNTYYPEKIEYRNFETTERGVFYLPEKIDEGHYYFKQITEVEGYDKQEFVRYDVDDIYDWPDPFVVSVELSPAKNIIPISMEDVYTHEPICDGTFQVLAAQDIITADATIRYMEGVLADTILLDNEGKGSSKELYLGTYRLTQDLIPRYYASLGESTEVEVRKKSEGEPETVRFLCQKTKITVKLTDELYTNTNLEGASFTLACADHPEFTQTGITDAQGEIVFTNLEKNTHYQLRQTEALPDYQYDPTPIDIYVTLDGRIDELPEVSYHLTNFIPRVSICVRDQIFNNPISNTNAALYSADGQLIRSWTTSATPEMFVNLPAGNYYVLAHSRVDARYDYVFSADEALQAIVIRRWSMQDIVAIGTAALVLLIVVLVVIKLLTRKRRR